MSKAKSICKFDMGFLRDSQKYKLQVQRLKDVLRMELLVFLERIRVYKLNPRFTIMASNKFFNFMLIVYSQLLIT